MDFYRAFTWRARGVGNCVCYNFTVELHQVFFQNLEQMGDRKKERKKNTHTKMGGGGYPAAFYGPDVSGLSIPSAWAMDIFYGSDVNSRTAPSTFTIEPRKGNG